MSRPFSGWILNAAKQSPTLVRGGRRPYSQCLLRRNHARWGRSRSAKAAAQTCTPLHRIAAADRSYRHAAEDVPFQLSPEQINYVLRANEQTHAAPNQSSVLRFESNVLASNAPCEDRRSAATCLQTKGQLFGVFDGHAGSECAQSVSERLFYYIAVSLMSQETLEEIEFAREHMKPVPPILQWHKHRNDYAYREIASLYADHLRVYWQQLIDLDNESGMGAADAMAHAFHRLDSDISLEAQVPAEDGFARSLALQIAFSGCTACVSHVDGVHLHVANAGDCRAVLGVQEGDGAWSALPLTSDHNAFNASELRRVRSEHPPSEEGTVVTDQRLLGILMPFRAFGDVRFKWSEELQKSVLRNACDAEPLNIYQYYPANYHTPPYLTAAPEVTYHRLRPQDKFLVMASDGLWDMLESRDAVRLVAEHVSEWRMQQPPAVSPERRSLGYMQNLLLKRRLRRFRLQDQNVATHLIRNAVGCNEAGEVDPERLAAMLSLPDDVSRMYRDDITVTVVFFNSRVIADHYRENQ